MQLKVVNIAREPRGSNKTRHVYVGIETAEEYEIVGEWWEETATLLREFLWGDPSRFPEPLGLVTHGGENGGQGGTGVPAGESVYDYLHDVLGSVVGLTDSMGVLVERYTYDPYGRTLIENQSAIPIPQSAFGNTWMWTGQRYEPVTGLYAFLFRAYSPSLGRWLQRDPAGYIDGANLYEYVMGNPFVWRDPLGLWGDGCNAIRKRLCQAKKAAEYLCGKARAAQPGRPAEAAHVKAELAAESVARLEAALAKCISGHSDFPGNEEFDYTKEDYGWTHPHNPFSTGHHFQTLAEAGAGVDAGIANCDKDAFERAMHRGQDSFSHRDAGFGPIEHAFAGHVPDDSTRWRNAYRRASEWTQQQVDKWNKNCEKGPDGKWRKRQSEPKPPPSERPQSGGC